MKSSLRRTVFSKRLYNKSYDGKLMLNNEESKIDSYRNTTRKYKMKYHTYRENTINRSQSISDINYYRNQLIIPSLNLFPSMYSYYIRIE